MTFLTAFLLGKVSMKGEIGNIELVEAWYLVQMW